MFVSVPVRVLLVDDHEMLRESMGFMLESGGKYRVIASVGSVAAAEAFLIVETPDIILLDIRLPGLDGWALLKSRPDLAGRVLVFSASAGPLEVKRAQELGAGGFLTKRAGKMNVDQAVRQVLSGGFDWANIVMDAAGLARSLSWREMQVLDCLRRGLTNSDAGRVLEISENTVKTHVREILSKLGAADRAEAVARGFETGLLS